MRSRKLNSFKFFARVIVGLFLIFFAAKSSAKDWNVHKTNLNVVDAEMKKLKEEINALIEEKRKTEEPAELRVITQGMADKYKELQKLDKQAHNEELHMRFQHPEKGDQQKREYTRGKLKTLEEMENEFGLDARLNRIQAKVRKVYGIKEDETKAKQEQQVAKESVPEVVKRLGHEYSNQERMPASEKKSNRPAEADERIHFSK